MQATFSADSVRYPLTCRNRPSAACLEVSRQTHLRRYALLGAFSCLALFPTTASGVISTVALTGQQAADLPVGVQYATLNQRLASVNSVGQVAFSASLAGPGVTTSNSDGIWMGTPGAIHLLAREGDPAPGMASGEILTGNFDCQVNDAGQILLRSSFSNGSYSGTGFWLVRPGDLRLLAKTGDQAPGTADGVTFSYMETTDFNSQGQTILHAILTGPGVTSSNEWGYWLLGPNGTRLIARKGDQAPGTPAGTTYVLDWFKIFPTGTIRLDQSGRVAFITEVTGPSANNVGIWLNDGGTTSLIARQGDPAPGTAPGEGYLFYSSGSNFITGPVLTDSGELAFHAKLNGPNVTSANDDAIWMGPPDNLTLRLRDGQQASGTGLPLSTLGMPYPNEAGQFAFVGGVSNSKGIWIMGPEGLRLIARQGQPAPGGYYFDDTISEVLNCGSITINVAGQVAFASGLTVLGSWDKGLWIDDQGQLFRVVGSGDTLAGQTVFAVSLGVSNVSNFELNEHGQLFFHVDFDSAGQNQGLFLYSPGVPGDFNADGKVDAADYVLWRNGLGTTYTQADYNTWRANFGATAGSGVIGNAIDSIPEPTSGILLTCAIAFACELRRRTKCAS